MSRLRLRIAGLIVAAVVPLGSWLVAPAAATPSIVIPEAPVFPIVAKTETLPFSLDADGDGFDDGTPVEVAVLTDGATIDHASWTETKELALGPYAGKTIRVLARAKGETDPANYFDATYAVRDIYSPGVGLGTDANPSTGIAASDTRFVASVSRYVDYQPGTNVSSSWKSAWDGTNTPMMVLGDAGKVTAEFRSNIVDGTGDDFAVFENGFRITNSDKDFLELAYVEVSSDGQHFVRFDSASQTESDTGAFGGILASNIAGVAGKDLNNYGVNYGTGFDLASLKNKKEVRSGEVNLGAISQVRIVDIAGCGSDFDSFGRVIYDPCGTAESGGFDLTGIKVIHQADTLAWVDVPTASDLGPTSATISTSVTTNDAGGQTVVAEISDKADHSNPRTVGTAAVAAGARNRALSFSATGLTRGTTYYYRVRTSSAADGSGMTATDWRTFTAPDIQVGKPQVVSQSGQNGLVTVPLLLNVNPFGVGKDLMVKVEYSSNLDYSNPRYTTPQALDGRYTWAVYLTQYLTDLNPAYDYFARTVVTDSDGNEFFSDWLSFTTEGTPSAPSASSAASLGAASDTALIDHTLYVCTRVSAQAGVSGLYAAIDWLDFETFQSTQSPKVPVSLVSGAGDVCAHMSVGSSGGFGSLSLYNADGSSASTGLGLPGFNGRDSDKALVAAPAVSGVTATSASFAASGDSQEWGSQSVSFEYAPVSDPDAVTVSSAFWGTASWAGSVTEHNLKPGTDYRVRTVSTSRLDPSAVVTSDWVSFATPDLPAALGTATVSGITRSSAVVSVPVNPAGFERTVSAEVSPAAGGDSVSSAPMTVAAGATAASVDLPVTGLQPNTKYTARVTSTALGAAESTAWVDFTTGIASAVVGPMSVSGLASSSATVSAVFTAGDLDQAVWVEYTSQPDRSKSVASEKTTVRASLDPSTVSVGLAGMAPKTTFSYRFVAESSTGRVTSDWQTLTTNAVTQPAVSIKVSSGTVQVGSTITVSWASSHADSVAASGSWSGAKALSGSERITLKTAGSRQFIVTAVGEGGAKTVASVTVAVSLAPKKLSVSTQAGPQYVGKWIPVKGAGLAAGEKYVITIAGIAVASGNANSQGALSRYVLVPRALAATTQSIAVTGSTPSRVGTARIQVVAGKRLPVSLSTTTVRRGRTISITVWGLAASEPVTVTVAGKAYRGSASSKGSYIVKFTAPAKARIGKTTAKATGLSSARTGFATVTIRR